jgi:hypothetical protein
LLMCANLALASILGKPAKRVKGTVFWWIHGQSPTTNAIGPVT